MKRFCCFQSVRCVSFLTLRKKHGTSALVVIFLTFFLPVGAGRRVWNTKSGTFDVDSEILGSEEKEARFLLHCGQKIELCKYAVLRAA